MAVVENKAVFLLSFFSRALSAPLPLPLPIKSKDAFLFLAALFQRVRSLYLHLSAATLRWRRFIPRLFLPFLTSCGVPQDLTIIHSSRHTYIHTYMYIEARINSRFSSKVN